MSVYGVDHPGIVHAVSRRLAERGVSITDLETRLVGGADGEPVYAMMLEVARASRAPTRTSSSEASPRPPARQHVELSFRPLELDAL